MIRRARGIDATKRLFLADLLALMLLLQLTAGLVFLSRRQIMDAAWGVDHHGTERTVDNFVAQLRAKLEANPSDPKHLVTVRGVGYRLAA